MTDILQTIYFVFQIKICSSLFIADWRALIQASNYYLIYLLVPVSTSLGGFPSQRVSIVEILLRHDFIMKRERGVKERQMLLLIY